MTRNEMRLFDPVKETVLVMSKLDNDDQVEQIVAKSSHSTAPSYRMNSSADGTFKSAVGLRLGWPTSLSYKMFLNESAAVEGMLGYRNYGFGVSMISLDAAYQIHQDIQLESMEGLQFYYGGGAGINRWTADGYNGEGGASAVLFSVKGYAGLSYTLDNIPLNISIDAIPSYYFGGSFDTLSAFGVGLAVAARYVIN